MSQSFRATAVYPFERSPSNSTFYGGGDLDDRHTDENHPYDGSGLAPRACTDMLCLTALISFLVGLLGVLLYSFQYGNPERLTHGYNYKGLLCGVDDTVSEAPFLYWCGAGSVLRSGIPTALDLKFPICVRECPTDIYTEMACLGMEQVQVDATGTEPFIEKKATITQSIVKQLSYPTFALAGQYCLPHLDDRLELPGADPLTKSLMGNKGPLGSTWQISVNALGSLRTCWLIVAAMGLIAMGLGYAFLFAVRRFAKQTVEVTLLAATVLVLLLGAFCFIGDLLQGGALDHWRTWNRLFRLFDRDTAESVSRLCGLCFTLMGMGTLALMCLSQDAIQTAIGCIEVAGECIFTMPSLLLQPALEATLKLAIAGCLLCGCGRLLSTAEMVPDFITVQGVQVGGLTRTLVFSSWGKAMLAFYAFSFFWLMEVTSAVSQFVTSYSVILWYYTPKPKGEGPSIPLVRGIIVAMIFHLGTLALGAFLVGACRILRIAVGHLAKQAKVADGNRVCEAMEQCLNPIFGCFHQHIEFINKNAYIDVCISCTGFLKAAKNTFGFISTEGGKVAVLTGACYLFSLTGTLGISSACGTLAYALVVCCQPDVANPFFVAGVAAVLTGWMATCFTSVLDHTADTLLYAYVWNKSHGHNTVQKYAPEALVGLTEYKPISRPGRVGSETLSRSNSGMFKAFNFFANKEQKASQVSAEETSSLMRSR